MLVNDIQFAKFVKAFPHHNFALYGIYLTNYTYHALIKLITAALHHLTATLINYQPVCASLPKIH